MVRTITLLMTGILLIIAGFGTFIQGYLNTVPYPLYVEIVGAGLFIIGLAFTAIGFSEYGLNDRIKFK
ncbi:MULTISPECIES: hypothetical protein [Acidiplasma]|jgi:hypothetical protein|nr:MULTISPECIES: hypothetical protein [Acidiplasma]WMT54273.1 MAG: hypothetical protein RE470_04995 [Acidiplasma sp.]